MENFYVLSMIVIVMTLIFGFNSINYKLKIKNENDERIVERLDLIINRNTESKDD
jgi:hypothetical protein